jgi:acyl-CoA synthetase (AMP-forming)/AMP-acid ligase II
VTFNLADLFELVVDAVADRTAMVTDTGRWTYAAIDERANRLANHLAAAGVRPNQHIGLMAYNGTEYVEGMLAAFKLRAVPVNVNYRYVSKELLHLFDDADLVGLIFHREFGGRVASVARELPRLATFLVIDQADRAGGAADDEPPGTTGYEEALAASRPERPDAIGRSGDDLYCAYTGGTTGLPKGVMWRHEDIFFASLGGGDPIQMGDFITSPEELPGRLPEAGMVALPPRPSCT